MLRLVSSSIPPLVYSPQTEKGFSSYPVEIELEMEQISCDSYGLIHALQDKTGQWGFLKVRDGSEASDQYSVHAQAHGRLSHLTASC